GAFEHRRRLRGGTVAAEHTTLHVLGDKRRVATVRAEGPLDTGDAAPDVQYHLGDHLGGSALVLDRAGAWVNREEYTPFGETSFGGFARKRYRFGGKERDEESGLYYFGARYYAPWVARWTTPDPSFVNKAAGGGNRDDPVGDRRAPN